MMVWWCLAIPDIYYPNGGFQIHVATPSKSADHEIRLETYSLSYGDLGIPHDLRTPNKNHGESWILRLLLLAGERTSEYKWSIDSKKIEVGVSMAMGVALYRWMLHFMENPIVRNGWWLGGTPIHGNLYPGNLPSMAISRGSARAWRLALRLAAPRCWKMAANSR